MLKQSGLVIKSKSPSNIQVATCSGWLIIFLHDFGQVITNLGLKFFCKMDPLIDYFKELLLGRAHKNHHEIFWNNPVGPHSSMATPTSTSVLYRGRGADATCPGSGAALQGLSPWSMPGTGHPLGCPPPLHLPGSDCVHVPVLILKGRSYSLCSVWCETGPQCSVIPRMPRGVQKFAAVNGVSRQGRDIQLPGPLPVPNETKKWSFQAMTVKLNKRTFWKKPALLYVLSRERTSRTLLLTLKNPLMRWDAFCGSKRCLAWEVKLRSITGKLFF